MALKALMLRKKIDLKNKELEAARAKMQDIEKREAEIAAAIEEVATEEEQAAVQESVEAITQEKATAQAAVDSLGETIRGLEAELATVESEQDTTPPEEQKNPVPEEKEERGAKHMINMNRRDRLAELVVREDVKAVLAEVRSAIKEKRAVNNANLTIPVVMLDLIRYEIAQSSKLLKFVRLRNIGGTGRQNIMGEIPEAVWTEATGAINELDIGFNQIEVDGFKVSGYFAVPNSIIEDSDVDLAEELIVALGGAIAKALDKAILFGTGVKMPMGIVTRLAQTAQPASWGTNDRAWTDLHETNMLKISAASESGAKFFQRLVEKLGVAKPLAGGTGLFWVMNRKTHMDILAKCLAFNASAALVANTTLMPIVGGEVVEVEDSQMADYEIVGGFGSAYLLSERAGVKFASSDHALFIQDQTVYKGTARYDGKPVFGEAFVVVNYNNVDPTTSKDFPEDYANTELNDLVVTAAVGASAGKTVLTVSNTIAESNPVLKYKLGEYQFETGDTIGTGFAPLASGTTAITAPAGKKITVVELDSANRVVSAGVVISVPKT